MTSVTPTDGAVCSEAFEKCFKIHATVWYVGLLNGVKDRGRMSKHFLVTLSRQRAQWVREQLIWEPSNISRGKSFCLQSFPSASSELSCFGLWNLLPYQMISDHAAGHKCKQQDLPWEALLGYQISCSLTHCALCLVCAPGKLKPRPNYHSWIVYCQRVSLQLVYFSHFQPWLQYFQLMSALLTRQAVSIFSQQHIWLNSLYRAPREAFHHLDKMW